MKRLNRKEKIKKIHQLASGKDSERKSQLIILDKANGLQLKNLLALRELPQEEIEKVFREQNVYTDEELLEFLNSDEFALAIRNEDGDHILTMQKSEDCEPIINIDETGVIHIVEFKDYSKKTADGKTVIEEEQECDAIKAPLQDPQHEMKEEPQQEEITESKATEQEPASIKLIKDNREQEIKIFNLLGEVMEQDKERAERMNEFRKRFNQLN